jgi:hypothetical protein
LTEEMIYCVEDDDSIRELMVYALSASGFEAVGCPNAEAFWKAVKDRPPELVILDIMLPDEDGIRVLKKLREQAATRDLPVIMATAKGTEYDKVIGLDLGADDYMAKPFGMMEMIARIRALLRRTCRREETAQLHAGKLELNCAQHTVRVAGEKVELTRKEFDLLLLFLENPGKVFTRDALLNSVWETDYEGETRTVDVHIGTLRTKLKECGGLIQTVRGVGYRMEADR